MCNDPSCNDLLLASDEVRAGLIPGITFGYKQITYSVVDDLAIFEGCIVLGSVNEVEQITADIRRAIEDAGEQGREEVEHGVGITGQRFRWPHGIVPYIIDPNLPNQERVTEAIEHWEQNTNITFIERTANNENELPNFVRFTPGNGCSSFVGMRLGGQDITLANGCTRGSVIHEIGHAVGLWHEQSREDRDQFVTINFQNISAGREHNFNQHIVDGDDINNYDYDSIMHYGPTAFTSNGLPTIVPIQQGETIGQRNGLSAGDIAAVRAMYPGGDPNMVRPKPGSALQSSSPTFVWSANGESVLQWWLYIGSSQGSSNYYNSGSLGTNLTNTAIQLPTNGNQLYVRLWFRTVGGWQFTDYQYTAATS